MSCPPSVSPQTDAANLLYTVRLVENFVTRVKRIVGGDRLGSSGRRAALRRDRLTWVPGRRENRPGRQSWVQTTSPTMWPPGGALRLARSDDADYAGDKLDDTCEAAFTRALLRAQRHALRHSLQMLHRMRLPSCIRPLQRLPQRQGLYHTNSCSGSHYTSALIVSHPGIPRNGWPPLPGVAYPPLDLYVWQ
jgi:hypothetical protein